MNALGIATALAQAELQRRTLAQAKQIAAMHAAIDALEKNRWNEGNRWASCCRACFQVRFRFLKPCAKCKHRVCGACVGDCDYCGSHWCPACQAVAPCGTCGRALPCCPVCAASPDCRACNEAE